MITVITPIRDRPAGFNLCRKWMARQSCREDIEWIVVDDGDFPVGPHSDEYRYLRRKNCGQKFTNHRNILLGLEHAIGEVVMYVEDDDWISSDYVKNMVSSVQGYVAAALSGDLIYHIGYRRYMDKRIPPREAKAKLRSMASFCVTGEGIELLRETCREAIKADDPLIDIRFWKLVSKSGLPFKVFTGFSIVKIKGIPGRSITWKHGSDVGSHDTDEEYLRRLIGNEDVDAIIKASEGWDKWIEGWTKDNLGKKRKRTSKGS